MKKNNTAKRIKKKVNKQGDSQNKSGGIVKAATTGFVSYVVMSLITTLCLAVAISGTNDPDMFILPCVLFACLISSAVSGALFKTSVGFSSFLSGILNAITLIVMTFLFSVLPFVNKNGQNSLSKVLVMVAITLGSVVGSAIKSKKRKKVLRHTK